MICGPTTAFSNAKLSSSFYERPDNSRSKTSPALTVAKALEIILSQNQSQSPPRHSFVGIVLH